MYLQNNEVINGKRGYVYLQNNEVINGQGKAGHGLETGTCSAVDNVVVKELSMTICSLLSIFLSLT